MLVTRTMMDTFERVVKTNVLFFFCVLNIVDMVQTWTFLRMGIEANLVAVNHPPLWFLLKAALAFGLPLGLYQLDAYLDGKADEGLLSYVNGLVTVAYVMILFADFFFFSLVVKNSHVLGGL